VKSRGSQCNETLLVRAAVRPGKKLGLQSAAKNVQWRRCAYVGCTVYTLSGIKKHTRMLLCITSANV